MFRKIKKSIFGTPQWAKILIREAIEKNAKELDLSGGWNDKRKKLTQIPDELFELTNLQVLNLSGNALTTVPEAITQLTNLQELDLARNALTTVLEAITQLTNLQKLRLSSNRLTEVPEADGATDGLTEIGFIA